MNTSLLVLFLIAGPSQFMESPYYYDNELRFSFRSDDPGGDLVIMAYFKDDPWYGGRKRYGEKWESFKGRNHISVNASILVKRVNGWMEYEEVGGTPLLLHLPSGVATVQAEYENQWITKDVAIFPNETTTIEFEFNKKNPTKQWYSLIDQTWLEYTSVFFTLSLFICYLLGAITFSSIKNRYARTRG